MRYLIFLVVFPALFCAAAFAFFPPAPDIATRVIGLLVGAMVPALILAVVDRLVANKPLAMRVGIVAVLGAVFLIGGTFGFAGEIDREVLGLGAVTAVIAGVCSLLVAMSHVRSGRY